MTAETLKRGSVVATPDQRVGVILRHDLSRRKPGVWWLMRMLDGINETHEQATLEFLYQERNR